MKKLIILILIMFTTFGVSWWLWYLYKVNSIFPTSTEKIRQMILQNESTEIIEKQLKRMKNNDNESITVDLYKEIGQHTVISDEDMKIMKWLDTYNFKNNVCISNRDVMHSLEFYINHYRKTKDIIFLENVFKKGYINPNIKLQGPLSCDSLLFTILYSFPDKDFIRILLENGADVNVVNSAGITPKEWIKKNITSIKQVIDGYKNSRKEKDNDYYDSEKEYLRMIEIKEIINRF